MAIPLEPAARIAIATVRAELTRAIGVEEVVFCCFSTGDLAVYELLLVSP